VEAAAVQQGRDGQRMLFGVSSASAFSISLGAPEQHSNLDAFLGSIDLGDHTTR
jgi:hypothetical protein